MALTGMVLENINFPLLMCTIRGFGAQTWNFGIVIIIIVFQLCLGLKTKRSKEKQNTPLTPIYTNFGSLWWLMALFSAPRRQWQVNLYVFMAIQDYRTRPWLKKPKQTMATTKTVNSIFKVLSNCSTLFVCMICWFWVLHKNETA